MRLVGMRFMCAAAVALALLGSVARADLTPPPAEALLQRADELVRWIAERSDYPAELKRPPNFVFLTPADMRQMFSGASTIHGGETRRVFAAQVRDTIYLPTTFRLGRDDYILLHELVHYLQDQTGKRYPCLAMREREAYEFQIMFVRETGVGEIPNEIFMKFLRCDIRWSGFGLSNDPNWDARRGAP